MHGTRDKRGNKGQLVDPTFLPEPGMVQEKILQMPAQSYLISNENLSPKLLLKPARHDIRIHRSHQQRPNKAIISCIAQLSRTTGAQAWGG